MRLWTLHPRYLDAKGLVALWREGLLAQKVLQGATRGYRQHPQLVRFREAPDSVAAIATYLQSVVAEASERGYTFDATKIAPIRFDVGAARAVADDTHRWIALADLDSAGLPTPVRRILDGCNGDASAG